MFTETCTEYMAGEIRIGTLNYLTMIPEVQKKNVHQIPKVAVRNYQGGRVANSAGRVMRFEKGRVTIF